MFRCRRLPVLVAILAGLAATPPVLAAEGAAHRPVKARTGARVTPPTGLLEIAQAVRAAAEVKDATGVHAHFAPRLVFVDAGITLGVGRTARSRGPQASADAALAAVGAAFDEGGPMITLDGTVHEPAETTRIDQALEVIAEVIGAAHWGRDPMVPDAICTTPGARWDPHAATKAGIGGERGVFVTTPTSAWAEPSSTSTVVATLKPGLLYVSEGSPEGGWRPVRLPDGRTAHVEVTAVEEASAWGVCFDRGHTGDWRLSAIVSALN